MDDSAQGIVDQPVSQDEMAAIDQAASQYGAVVQPASAMPTDDNTQVSGSVPGVVQPSAPTEDVTPTPVVDEPFVEPTAAEEVTPEPVAEEPVNNDTTPAPITDGGTAEPVAETPAEPADDSSTMTAVTPTESGVGTDEELLGVKQQALEELTPIVDTLDLPAEEKFDTLMMIIRASDDKKLVKPAYDAANQITDKDKKARALLDVVNEVNYLTQNNPDKA